MTTLRSPKYLLLLLPRLGLRAALYLSEKHAGLSPASSKEILALLEKFELPLVLDHAISSERVLEKLSRDKKFEAGKIRFVLLRAPGDAYLSDQVTPKDLAEAVANLRSPL